METSLNIPMSQQKTNSITKAMQQFGKNLFGFVRGRVRSTEDAEDILQDVWYQLSNLPTVDDLDSISGWLYEVAQNKITDKSRKKKNLLLEDFGYENDEGEFNFKEILLADEYENPELEIFKEIFWKELLKSLDELPPNQKEVFILNELEDLTLQEIADKKGENIKTIISRKGYAVKYLRSKLNYLYKELNY